MAAGGSYGLCEWLVNATCLGGPWVAGDQLVLVSHGSAWGGLLSGTEGPDRPDMVPDEALSDVEGRPMVPPPV